MVNYSIDCGLGGDNVVIFYEDVDMFYILVWQECIIGVLVVCVMQVVCEFVDSVDKICGKVMVIIGVVMNYWYYMDMNYCVVINMLMMCGCIGQSGGGWVYYVGQEKLCLQIGWVLLVFGLDWSWLLWQMNGISFFYLYSL